MTDLKVIHTPDGDRGLQGHHLPVEHPVRILDLCRSRSGVWRHGHTYDRDGTCVFCDRDRRARTSVPLWARVRG